MILGCLLLASLTVAAGTASPPKVAVIPFSNEAAQRRISGEWETLLLSAGYRVVERGDIGQVLREQGLSLMGVTDPRQAPKVGGLLGVQGILVGLPNPKQPFHSYDMAGLERLCEPQPSSVKLVDLSSGKVFWSLMGKAGGSPGSTRPGQAVDAKVTKWLRKTLEDMDWESFPEGRFRSRESGGVRIAFNPHLDHRKRMRVAAYPFHSGHQNQDGREWADQWAGALAQAGYEVIDRVHLEEVLEEQRFGLTGALRPSDLPRMGRLAGVDAVLFGSIYGSPICAYSAKLADAQTGELYWSAFGESCSLKRVSSLLADFLKKED
ncbi:MAG: hypothetical protein HY748_08090 [Elusimicrobia bacterium]|nr:hypothetical protein [Elusimicrobiota bacterium]